MVFEGLGTATDLRSSELTIHKSNIDLYSRNGHFDSPLDLSYLSVLPMLLSHIWTVYIFQEQN